MSWPFYMTQYFKRKGLATGTLSIAKQVVKCREDRSPVLLLLFGKFGVYHVVA